MSSTSPIKKRGRPPKVHGGGGLVEEGRRRESQMLVVIDHGSGTDGEQVYAIVGGEQCGTVTQEMSDDQNESSVKIVPVVDEESGPRDVVGDAVLEDETFVDDTEAIADVQNDPVALAMTEEQNGETFRCSVCHQNVNNQREFFNHLKSHYEPPGPGFKSETKKRGRKRKSETAKPEPEESKVVVLVNPTDIVVEKKTRSGRISRPKKFDYMISLSPPRIKTEPKLEPEEDLDFSDDFTIPAQKPKNPIRTELGDEMDADADAEITEKPKPKRPTTEPRQRRPRKNLASYKRVQSSENGSVKLECEICHKLLANSTSFSVHQRIHKGEKPFKCDQCDRSFRQFSDLGYHIASIHSDKKAYQCEFCGKEFSRKYSLTIHQKIHTGIRDYKCEVCQRGFRAAIYLQEHRRIHTGEKPFLCDVCGRGFRIKSDMYRHRQNVHYKGNKAGTTVYIKSVDEDAMEEVMVEEGGSENEEEAQFVTITTKDGEEEGEEGGTTSQTMHRLVFISETEAILV